MSELPTATDQPAGPDPVLILTDTQLPSFFRASDAASMRGQRQSIRTTAVVLTLTVSAALAATITVRVTLRDIDIGAIISGLAFALAIVGSIYLLQMRPEKAWYDGRAGAESARTLAWLYAVGGAPFNIDGCEDPDGELLEQLGLIAKQLGRLALSAEVGYQITDKMRMVRASSLASRKTAYMVGRIEAELEWYQRKAEWNAKREDVWRRVTLGLQGIGLAVAIARVSGLLTIDLLGLIAAAVAATSAWLEAKDYGTLAEAYSITAVDLSLARERALNLINDPSEENWSRFVEGAELAISREHTLWLARGGVRWP
jgi:SMODS and SLOG-associating 2TM effector domain 3/SMODS and SLOG-associating 2TM effector domain 1